MPPISRLSKLRCRNVTTPGNAIPSIDLRNHFEVTSIQGPVAQFRTSLGTYNLELFPAAAPATVPNFLTYVNGGRYAGTFIHRSDQGLGVIQGGGYEVTATDPLNVERIATDPPIVLEYNLPNTRGTIAMARTAVLNSATSEWFINTVDNTNTLGQGNGGGYAVFGRVTGTGMTVVDAIHALTVYQFQSPYGQLPLIGYTGGQVVVANLVMINGAESVPIFPTAAGQNSVVSFSVTNSNPTLVTATITGSTLNLVLAAGQVGFADLTVTATDTNGNAVQNSFRINVPEISVEQPAGNTIADGGSRGFAAVNVGSSANLIFTIKNIGGGNVVLTGNPKVVVDGPDAGDFTVITQPVSPITGPGGSTTFMVRFTPATLGLKTAALHIANDDADENPFDINLTGLGAMPEISVEQPTGSDVADGGSRPFSVVHMGSTVDLAFTLKNTGDGPLALTGTPRVMIDGADAGMFAVTAQPASTVAAGGSTTFTVRFTPTSAGQKSAALHIENDDADENPFDIDLTGTGNAQPTLTLPNSPLTAEPNSTNGAIVNFLVTANDAEDGPLTAIVTPPSGSTFPLGDTTVNVSAADANGAVTTGSFTVSVRFQRPAETTVTVSAQSGEPAPGAGAAGLPANAVLHSFGPPAVNDFRALAARATLSAGSTLLSGIYVEDGAGLARMAAYKGGSVPGISSTATTFKKFSEPVMAVDGSIGFIGTLTGGGVSTSQDTGVWTDAFGSGMQLVLREGSQVPGLPTGAKLKAVSSISLRNGELLALLTLKLAKGVVTDANDTVLLHMTGADAAIVLLREGRALNGFGTSKIKSFRVLSPAQGSPGHGRWHAEGTIVAKVTLHDGRTLLVKLAPDGTVTPILSSADIATPVSPFARWKSMGLPAMGSAGAGFTVAATLKPDIGGVIETSNEVLLSSPDGAAWSVFARERDPAPVVPAGPRYAGFLDPFVNEAGHVAFLATLQGAGVNADNGLALFNGPANDPQLIARLGDSVPDEDGVPTTAVWKKLISSALPSGPGAGPIFLAKTRGGDTSTENNLGLWAVDSQGTVRRLLRTGTPLSDGGPLLTGLQLLNAAPGAFGVTRSFNASGSIALVATFADGTQALLRVDIP